MIHARTFTCKYASYVLYKSNCIYTSTELEITVGHWPFPTNIAILAEQNLIARTNLLYISYGKAIIMFLLLINGRPISNPYFKLCKYNCILQIQLYLYKCNYIYTNATIFMQP